MAYILEGRMREGGKAESQRNSEGNDLEQVMFSLFSQPDTF
jgi:hypothetical protein